LTLPPAEAARPIRDVQAAQPRLAALGS